MRSPRQDLRQPQRYGRRALVRGGPAGHAATLTYELRADANGTMVPTYRIQNDVSGWGKSKSPSAAHWLNGWGRGITGEFAGMYTLYATEALSDWVGYVRSYETRLIAASLDEVPPFASRRLMPPAGRSPSTSMHFGQRSSSSRARCRRRLNGSTWPR